MEKITELYELLSTDSPNKKEGHVVNKKRVLIGRSQACDIVLSGSDVTAIHAVLEIQNNGFKIYDMNSTNGTFVNGEKVVAKEFGVNDKVQFGTSEFCLKLYDSDDMVPPPLDMLEPSLPPVMMPPVLESKPELPQSSPDFVEVPRVAYPLAADPKAEFSEYIFEDIDTLYPIFNYQTENTAVEIIILFKDKIYSVDYIPTVDGSYSLVGSNAGNRELEYAYLGKSEKVPFVEISNSEIIIHHLSGYNFLSLSDSDKDSAGPIRLGETDILRYEKGDLQVFVRGSEAPPQVAAAPIFRRDSDFKKYLLLTLLFVFSLLGTLSFVTVDKEVEKDKIPARMAKILYRPKKFNPKKTKEKKPSISKVKNKKTVLNKNKNNTNVASKKKSANKKKAPKTTKLKGTSKNSKKVGVVKKARPKQGRKNNKTKVTKKGKKTTLKKGKPQKSQRSKRVSKRKGRVDTYKNNFFKSTVSSLIAKGGNTKSVQAQTSAESEVGFTDFTSGDTSATAPRAEVSQDIGSIEGETTGKIDSSRGSEGLVSKRNIYTAGLPFKTVVLGGMDPDIIRQILVENIPQFRYCYQRVLDRSKRAFNGIVSLNFIIGASGHVSKAGVDSVSRLPNSVKGCVVNVLRGIKFPEPLGGGVVEVNQPLNFYPQTK